MRLPQLVDYREAVQVPEHSFLDDDLRRGSVRRNPQGVPVVSSGGFALTFDVTTRGGSRFAVRCFHKTGNHLRERYTEIAEFVRTHRSTADFLVDVAYRERGIRINGTAFPIVRMQWVEGTPLDYWVEEHLDRPDALDGIRRQLGRATAVMRAAGIAHGDLQHGNILVDPRGRIRLVDYDGMFLPALEPLGAAEFGHRAYQHPDRGDSYHRDLDSFSTRVIDLSLNALRHAPSLWQRFYTGDNLVFSAKDFTEPERSELFAELFRMPSLAEEARVLARACSVGFAAVPAILSGERMSVPVQPVKGGDRRASTGPEAVAAGNRTTMVSHLGDHVTAVGRITAVKQLTTKFGTPMSLLNFGDFRRGDFAVVAFEHTTLELRRVYGDDLAALTGLWVSITGLVTPYQRGSAKVVTPQIELKRVSSLRVLDEAKAKAMLAPSPVPSPPPAASPTAPATGVYRWSAPRRPRADDLDTRLSSLFSAPGFIATPTEPTTAANTSQPAANVPPTPPRHPAWQPPAPQPPTHPAPWQPTPPQPGWQPPAPPHHQVPYPPPPWQQQTARRPRRRPGFWQRLKRSLGL